MQYTTAIQKAKYLSESVLNSYAQVFFSKSKVFAVVLVLVSFFDVYAGIGGLIAVLTVNGLAWFMGINRQKIIAGAYGFNALMMGLGFGLYFQPGVAFYVLLVFLSILTLFITFAVEGVLGKYGLPYLSIPFLFGIWMAFVSAGSYSGLNLSERGVYALNEIYALGGMKMVRLYQWFDNLHIAESLRIYFKSLSAIFFQYHLFAGILLAAGLLYYSRIAFVLSLLGFFAAYWFYMLIGADISELSYSYIGFNYILMAIAVGGFFIIPSRRSFMWVILLTPLVAITLSSFSYLFSFLNLSTYSLSFNIIVIMFLYALKFREKNFEKLVPVTFQEFSPEKNVYGYKNYMQRFGNMPYVAVKLPFWGKWKITQAFDGEITHRGEWKYAWDFEITDQYGNPFRGRGTEVTDYYCYNKPVSAPADGLVVAVENGVEDNAVGEVNLDKNWGNSIVIKHAEQLYSQLSHLKKGSIKVREGDTVKKGDLLAYTGNSGRSPQPHLHFQFQSTPQIGSRTIKYPLSSYLVEKNGSPAFHSVAYPESGETVFNVQEDKTLKKAFRFVPGEKLTFEVTKGNQTIRPVWHVEVDYYNNSYLRCNETGAKAYFKIIGETFYFTQYSGKKDTLLYYFYLSSFKVLLGFYHNLVLEDNLPLNLFPNKKVLVVQDFLIPFVKILKADYQINYVLEEENSDEEYLLLQSQSVFGLAKKDLVRYDFELSIGGHGISNFKVFKNGVNIIQAKRI